MTLQIQPTESQLISWIKDYVPNRDIFFLGEDDYLKLKDCICSVLVMPSEEFFKHATYLQIQLVNSLEYWNISKNVRYVIIAQPSWVTTLEACKRKILLTAQVTMSRGLVLKLNYFPNKKEIPSDYIVENDVVIQNDMWNRLSYSVKENALKSYALEWDDWSSIETSNQTPPHINAFANTFPSKGGANCLAAVLYAISSHPAEQDWIIHEWVHQKTFLEGLKNSSYVQTDDELKETDVVAWVNEEGIIQHAAYHIGNQHLFNKNGQTFFNPWKIVHWDKLSLEWERYKTCFYRKINKID